MQQLRSLELTAGALCRFPQPRHCARGRGWYPSRSCKLALSKSEGTRERAGTRPRGASLRGINSPPPSTSNRFQLPTAINFQPLSTLHRYGSCAPPMGIPVIGYPAGPLHASSPVSAVRARPRRRDLGNVTLGCHSHPSCVCPGGGRPVPSTVNATPIVMTNKQMWAPKMSSGPPVPSKGDRGPQVRQARRRGMIRRGGWPVVRCA